MYTDILRSLREVVRRTHYKKWRTNFWFLLHDNAPALVGFDQRFLSKKQCVNTEASPVLSWTGCSWFLTIPTTEINLKGLHFCDPTDIIKMRRKSWKGFHKMACRNVFNNSIQPLAEVYTCTRGLFWRKCSLNVRIVVFLYFLELKWFR